MTIYFAHKSVLWTGLSEHSSSLLHKVSVGPVQLGQEDPKWVTYTASKLALAVGSLSFRTAW